MKRNKLINKLIKIASIILAIFIIYKMYKLVLYKYLNKYVVIQKFN